MQRDRLCFDEDLNIVTYCIDDTDFQIPFDTSNEKRQIISVMKTLKILNYQKTLSMMNSTRPATDNKNNIRFITKTIISELQKDSDKVTAKMPNN